MDCIFQYFASRKSRGASFVFLILLALSMSTSIAAEKDEEGFELLFNGKDLTGWEGNFDLWKVENECIVGDSPGIEHNQFLATKEKFDDFELRLEFRLKDGIGNTGVQFRSKRVEDSTEVEGYQADIGEKYWGCLYDESRRKRVLVQAPDELNDVLKKDDWNTYVIRAECDHVQLSINGFQSVDYVEQEAEIASDGIIALQVHSGKPLKIEFRNIRIKRLNN
ncbi:MAG: DUF1080 domain-containing protein [Planctomycetaceae bacterium]